MVQTTNQMSIFSIDWEIKGTSPSHFGPSPWTRRRRHAKVKGKPGHRSRWCHTRSLGCQKDLYFDLYLWCLLMLDSSVSPWVKCQASSQVSLGSGSQDWTCCTMLIHLINIHVETGKQKTHRSHVHQYPPISTQPRQPNCQFIPVSCVWSIHPTCRCCRDCISSSPPQWVDAPWLPTNHAESCEDNEVPVVLQQQTRSTNGVFRIHSDVFMM